MSWHFDLGYNGHIAIGRVRDNLPHVILRVEAAVLLAVEDPFGRIGHVWSDERLVAARTLLGQQRILLDLDAPTLVIGQVEVAIRHLARASH